MTIFHEIMAMMMKEVVAGEFGVLGVREFGVLTVCWICADVWWRTSSGARPLVTRRALAAVDPESYT